MYFKALPLILNGKNTVIKGETGCGKTLCYALPILNQLYRNFGRPIDTDNQRGALVLAPTKELCAQIYSLFRILDPKNKFKVYRTGALSYLAPIVQFLVSDSINV